jgi:hypothetical protein
MKLKRELMARSAGRRIRRRQMHSEGEDQKDEKTQMTQGDKKEVVEMQVSKITASADRPKFS